MHAQGEAQHERSDGAGRDDQTSARRECVDASVCEEEAELLHRQPHEGEIEESDSCDPGRQAHGIHDHGGTGQQGDRAPRCAFVRRDQRREEHLAEQEDPEEPQRLPEPEAGDRHQVVGNTVEEQHRQQYADDGDGDHGGQQQPVHARGDERGGGLAALSAACE